MNDQFAVTIQNLSKRYFKQGQKTLKELVHDVFVRHHKAGEFIWALKDVNFKIVKGETLGIIGANGSGKSTLLKMIAGVSKPTSGSLQVNGKISPLIELGAGFHPELTGRENVYLNGAILGMSKDEVDAKFQQIVDFSELKDFINTPVKYYSSGMYLRLAFAVAIHVNADILLVDEILAVGDSQFQAKCFNKMEELKKSGLTIVYVSHSLETVEKFCDCVVWLDHGQIKSIGKAKEVVGKYQKKVF